MVFLFHDISEENIALRDITLHYLTAYTQYVAKKSYQMLHCCTLSHLQEYLIAVFHPPQTATTLKCDLPFNTLVIYR